MNRRKFAAAIPAVAAAPLAFGDENPPELYAEPSIRKIMELKETIVSLAVHRDKIYVATERTVYELTPDALRF